MMHAVPLRGAALRANLSMEMATPHVIVIGASAGGVDAVARLVRELPANFPGAVFVAMHFPVGGTSVMPAIITRGGNLHAYHAVDGDPIVAGRVYVAPPDQHMLIGRKNVRLARGPRENGNRPAVDPMFRSAAVSHGRRVVGIVLTGNLDDGTAGLIEVKRRGGIAIVQDPAEALFPSMPASAIDHVKVDHILPLKQIPEALLAIVSRPAPEEGGDVPLHREDAMSGDAHREIASGEVDLERIVDLDNHPGEPSQFACPDCGGVLCEIKDGALVRYRCRVGHAWTAEGLLVRHSDQMDAALWMALRALEETALLQRNMAERSRRRGNDIMVAKFERDAHATEQRAEVIRHALLTPAPSQAEKAESTNGLIP